MDIETESSAPGSMEDKNGEIDTKRNNNGKCDGESVDGKIKVEGTVGKTESSASPSPPAAASKGRGLRKWRRIRRESSKEANNSLDSNRKRGSIAFPVAMKQRSEGSSSSTNAVHNALNHNPLYADLGSGRGSDFAARADSETSEDQNSRSSTAASAPRTNHELPLVGLSGKNSGISVQPGGQQEKGRSVTNKKARGVKIKKENSNSSVESDSRSVNFVFTQGANSNGKQSGRSANYEEDDSDDAQNGDRRLNEADSEGVSHEDIAAENLWEVKEEKVDDHMESGVRDALAESIMPLHLAQEALEREVEKLRNIGKEDTLFSDDCIQPSGSTFIDPTSFESARFIHDLKDAKISDLLSALNLDDIKTEHEELLKQRIAAELEYLVISKTIQDVKAGQVDQVNLAEPVQPDGAAEDERDLRKTVFRYGFWFTVQSILLFVVVYLFMVRFSSRNIEVIPT